MVAVMLVLSVFATKEGGRIVTLNFGSTASKQIKYSIQKAEQEVF